MNLNWENYRWWRCSSYDLLFQKKGLWRSSQSKHRVQSIGFAYPRWIRRLWKRSLFNIRLHAPAFRLLFRQIACRKICHSSKAIPHLILVSFISAAAIHFRDGHRHISLACLSASWHGVYFIHAKYKMNSSRLNLFLTIKQSWSFDIISLIKR